MWKAGCFEVPGMPKKIIEDGEQCSRPEAEGMAAIWDQNAKLRGLASSGKRLIRDAKGQDAVSATLENMQLNHDVLIEIAKKMKARKRLSADPMDGLILMFLGWYEKHKVQYGQNPSFDMQTWAFKDAWSVHKMLSKMRAKVVRPEAPRELWI